MELHAPLGKVHISDRVISKIAGMTVSSTEGMSMNAGVVEGVFKRISGKSLLAGIQVNASDAMVSIEMNIIVQYGLKIHEVCRDVQHNVQEAVERISGVYVNAVNVNVDGLALP
jgi:uncharacterized alkaline shock family protein YloU